MVQCNDNCVPACDFCIYAVHKAAENEYGGLYRDGVISCKRHPREKVRDEGVCEDFHCYKARGKMIDTISYMKAE